VRYVDWIDRVLVALDRLATADGTAALVGVGWHQLLQALGVEASQETTLAIFNTGRDLELLGCTEGVDQLRVKVTPQGQRIARAGGLRASWPSFFEQVSPLAVDRAALEKVVETSLAECDTYASAQAVELKEAMRLAGHPGDQNSAIAMAKRLERDHCIHPSPLITMGPDGHCQVRPTYLGIVITTEQVASELEELLTNLLADWETTSVDFKESVSVSTDREKAEFCKDVLALANTRVSGRRYLVIGFNDESRTFTTSVARDVDQERMEAILSAYCQPVPRISYSPVTWVEGTAGIIEVISDRADLPYKLARDAWKLKAGSIFVRHNTLTAVAEGEELTALLAEGQRARSSQHPSTVSVIP